MKVCVLGSINMDIVLCMDRMPRIGETVLASTLKKTPGGKGANQAVAARRLGAQVSMIGCAGMDEDGRNMVYGFKDQGIDIDHISLKNDSFTGTAVINVDNDGNNSIVVVSGANMKIMLEDIREAEKTIKESDSIVCQFETSIDASIEAFKIAKSNSVISILNPAPARSVPEELIKLTDIIIPNETECEAITGQKVFDISSAVIASKAFLSKGVKFVIVTLGDNGAALVSKDKAEIIPTLKVKAVDTTAAGDSFIGALASKLNKRDELNFESLKNAVIFANKVASIVVQREGAQSSLPYLKEI
jgi:ribokinase